MTVDLIPFFNNLVFFQIFLWFFGEKFVIKNFFQIRNSEICSASRRWQPRVGSGGSCRAWEAADRYWCSGRALDWEGVIGWSQVRIPRRPFWTPGISAEKLADMEMDNFLSWRKVGRNRSRDRFGAWENIHFIEFWIPLQLQKLCCFKQLNFVGHKGTNSEFEKYFFTEKKCKFNVFSAARICFWKFIIFFLHRHLQTMKNSKDIFSLHSRKIWISGGNYGEQLSGAMLFSKFWMLEIRCSTIVKTLRSKFEIDQSGARFLHMQICWGSCEGAGEEKVFGCVDE